MVSTWLVAATASAQAPEIATVPFGESVEVELVEVEVFVSDTQGKPVTGLTAADFTLTVDGARRDIAGFYEAAGLELTQRAELSTPAIEARAGEPPSPAAAAGTATPASAPERRMSLVVLVDDLHLQPAGRKRTLDRLAVLLGERVAAGDQVMIATLDRSLRVRRGFDATTPLAADLAGVYKDAPGGIHSEIDRRHALSIIREFYAGRGCDALPEMKATAESWSRQVDNESLLTLTALRSMLGSLAGRSGRKALLYVTEGMALNPGLEARFLVDELCPGHPPDPSTGLAARLHDVTRAANAAQVTLYTLDAGGQRTLASAVDAGPGLPFANESTVRSDAQDPAFVLAADTGGKALLESNRPELLVADLAQDLAAYYSLAFTPRPGDAGRAHRIGVEVKRSGVRVRHRSSWEPQRLEERLGGRLLAALRFGGEDANPLAARLEVGAPHREKDGSYIVPLRLVVPATGITLIPRGDRRQGRLRILLAVQDGEGLTTPVREMPLPVDLAASPAGAADPAQMPLEVRLKLREGRNLIAVAVHDEVGKETSVVRREVVVGRAAR
ncbi:MAG TPA: VWA domain-containing protein [Thermoanaerobaculia bacterium]|nr:VWA domain-containing protein [Thermoanaerobaculia bacterium]